MEKDQQRQGSSQGQKTWSLPRSWSLAIATSYFCLLLAMIVTAWLEAERLRTLSFWVLVLGLFWAGKLLRQALEERVAAIHTPRRSTDNLPIYQHLQAETTPSHYGGPLPALLLPIKASIQPAISTTVYPSPLLSVQPMAKDI